MAVFTWRAEVRTSGNGEFSMFSSLFGDGYSQEVPNGINNEMQKWSVVVSGKSSYVQEVLAFLRQQKGQPFEWKAPNTDGFGWYKCKRYSQNDEGGDYWNLTMEFEQAYAP
jgi:phage-related protein